MYDSGHPGAAGFLGRAVTAQLSREHLDYLGADRMTPNSFAT
jgi:nucleoside-diphosphate-sugar epimerase